ncbi:MAG TPA: SRPBCC family protein [Phycisphaerales bacterium]|jgi:uncharacterized protein YndB with AHSA1/START domain|nr:SRPBCC family protein [Phycisphaerales bacterium]
MAYVWIALGIVAAVVGLLVLAGVVLYVLGGKIPIEHEATSVIEIHAPVEKVFEAIADVQRHPEWSRGVSRVIVMPDTLHGGVPMQTVRMEMGHHSLVLVRTRYEPPMLLERTITDNRGPFSGTWLYRLRRMPDEAGEPVCEVRLTERGRVPSPVFRALMKHVMGYHKFTHAHVRALAGRFEVRAREPRRG